MRWSVRDQSNRHRLTGENRRSKRRRGHTNASLLIRSGAHRQTLQERLGHSTAAFTMSVYGHLLPGVQEEEVANVEAMLKRAENEPEKQVG